MLRNTGNKAKSVSLTSARTAVAVESALDAALLHVARVLTPGVVFGAVLGSRALGASGRVVTVVTAVIGSFESRIEAIGGVMAVAVNGMAVAVNGAQSTWREELSSRCPCLGCPCAQLEGVATRGFVFSREV